MRLLPSRPVTVWSRPIWPAPAPDSLTFTSEAPDQQPQNASNYNFTELSKLRPLSVAGRNLSQALQRLIEVPLVKAGVQQATVSHNAGLKRNQPWFICVPPSLHPCSDVSSAEYSNAVDLSSQRLL